MQVRLVERPVHNTTGKMTVRDLEKAKMAGHDRALGRTEEESGLCGVSKWYDNHWGIDRLPVTLGDQIAAMTKRNWPYFHLWSWNMYIVDPTGDAVQVDSNW